MKKITVRLSYITYYDYELDESDLKCLAEQCDCKIEDLDEQDLIQYAREAGTFEVESDIMCNLQEIDAEIINK